ncbi:hypothetical protein GQ43DRAFT_461549 [Delitschia confertaspora ATCC 74209]|uniref:Uncharacterized protein n=1 Tax=Delitschia confertaspora ATCC 74209 TaxID=1513339 RepID=A0A9P4MUW5_9PLEO|nr:hypothetical protein GQ43DRAFT_461549 [Delitschia confertaspora ATCC 74209]
MQRWSPIIPLSDGEANPKLRAVFMSYYHHRRAHEEFDDYTGAGPEATPPNLIEQASREAKFEAAVSDFVEATTSFATRYSDLDEADVGEEKRGVLGSLYRALRNLYDSRNIKDGKFILGAKMAEDEATNLEGARKAGEERWAEAGEERRMEAGEERRTEAGEERRMEAGEERRMETGEERRTETGEERRTETGEERRTKRERKEHRKQDKMEQQKRGKNQEEEEDWGDIE